MRTLFSLLLTLIAAVLAAVAVLGSGIDRAANTPEPVRRLAADLAADPGVRAELPGRLVDVVLDQLPVQIPSLLQPAVEGAVEDAVSGILDDPGFTDAWVEAADASRAGYVERLNQVGAGELDQAELRFELGPLASLGVERLQAAAEGFRLGGLLSGLDPETDVGIDLGVLGQDQARPQTTAEQLALAESWPWAAAVAGLAGLLGLLLAPPGRRGGALVAGGLAGALLAAGLAWWASTWPSTLAGAVGTTPDADLGASLLRAVGASLGEQATGLFWQFGAAAAAVAVVGLLWAAGSRIAERRAAGTAA
ncbi:hypothetical protein ACQ7DA_04225 [Zafaria sp. J156]|uniref:hypothetical protein n=1 Tax=Zafaria sp. J156 TaxID=3116490 RepID=UPI002E769E99|nr:hypothetical protein [Zafaria sp. J156]MEE1620431.1 hypothetical protein [Zafaria sp. J156]